MSTNLIDWVEIGAGTEISPGQYQFTDSPRRTVSNDSTNCARRKPAS